MVVFLVYVVLVVVVAVFVVFVVVLASAVHRDRGLPHSYPCFTFLFTENGCLEGNPFRRMAAPMNGSRNVSYTFFAHLLLSLRI